MEILLTFWEEILGFLGITQVLEILRTGDFAAFRTYDGVASLIYPIIPLLLLLELVVGLVHKRPQ